MRRWSLTSPPFFLALLAFCFSMTIGGAVGVLRVLHGQLLRHGYAEGHRGPRHPPVTLDPTRTNQVVTISGITDTAVNGESLGLGAT